jgi:hypothetical protein
MTAETHPNRLDMVGRVPPIDDSLCTTHSRQKMSRPMLWRETVSRSQAIMRPALVSEHASMLTQTATGSPA